MDEVLTYLEMAVHDAQRNYLQWLIIGVVSAVLMRRFAQIIIFAVLATIIHLAVSIYMSGWVLPDFLEIRELANIAFLLVGYIVVIAALFMIKNAVLRRH